MKVNKASRIIFWTLVYPPQKYNDILFYRSQKAFFHTVVFAHFRYKGLISVPRGVPAELKILEVRVIHVLRGSEFLKCCVNKQTTGMQE